MRCVSFALHPAVTQVLDIVRNLFAKGPVEKPLNLVSAVQGL
jgi:hypothetical protein